MNEHEDEALIWGLEGRSSEFKIYDISQIIEATGNFSEENKLGQGGFGPVYKVRRQISKNPSLHKETNFLKKIEEEYIYIFCN